MLNVKNEQFKNYLRIFKDAGKYSRTTRCFSRIKDTTSFEANSRTILGAQGRLATLVMGTPATTMLTRPVGCCEKRKCSPKICTRFEN